MGKKLTLLISVIALVIAIVNLCMAETYVSYGMTTTRLNVRKGPSTESAKLGTYPKGALVNVLEWDGGEWIRTDIGFIKAEYVKSFEGYLAEGALETQTQVYTVSDLWNSRMKDLRVRYLGCLQHDALAIASNGKGKEIKSMNYCNGYTMPIYEIIDGYAYFPYGTGICKLSVNAFTGFIWVGEFGDTGEIVGAYRTNYSDSSAERKHNIATAATAINGTIIESEKKFSFNDVVGPRTAKTGYQKATVFKDGKKAVDYGGGVCQVSTTLFAATLNVPELKVTERHAHSLKVSYVPYGDGIGMDATVSYGSQDLKFTNNFGFDIRIICIADGESLLVLLQRY